LQDSFIVKTGGTQALVIRGRDARGITSYLHNVIEHHPFLLGDRRGAVIVFEGRYQILVQSNATQKLCV
jgi:hypothetical protein